MTPTTAVLAALAATPLVAQAEPESPDPMIVAANDAAAYVRNMITKAAEGMSEEDYAFRPTPEGPELRGAAGARRRIELPVLLGGQGRGLARPRHREDRTHHGALHYGSVITYMRLRGKVPPSTAEAPSTG